MNAICVRSLHIRHLPLSRDLPASVTSHTVFVYVASLPFTNPLSWPRESCIVDHWMHTLESCQKRVTGYFLPAL